MNQRIKELALQAGAVNVWEWASDDVLDTKNMDAKKFAELLVQECCEVLQTETIRHDGYGYNQGFLHKKIKEHFGVEEK